MDSTFHFQTGQVHAERVVSLELYYKTLNDRVVGQYRACVIDLLGLEIHMCGVYYSIMRIII